MIFLIKHVFLLVCYFFLLGYSYNKNMPFFPFIIVAIGYYSMMIIPSIHKIYVYNILERTIPKWSYVIRYAFHYFLFQHDILRAFPATVTITLICLWKDIIFLINHAEKRLAKIEKIMYEDGDLTNKRICHLHLDVFRDDINNRFHKHCFDTNRLYLDSACTPYTTDMACSINNYRIIRKDNNTPKEFTGDDETAWRASSNKHIFISGRYEFYCLPLIMIVYLMAMTTGGNVYLVYMSHSLVCADLISTYFGRKINDVTIDISYLAATFFGIYLNANV